MTEPPSIAEVVRRLDDISRQIQELVRTQEERYATKEAVRSLREVHDVRIKELEKDAEAQAGFKRQVAAGAIVGFLLLLIPLIGMIQSLVGGAA